LNIILVITFGLFVGLLKITIGLFKIKTDLRSYRLWRDICFNFFIRFVLIHTIPIGMSVGINFHKLNFDSPTNGEILSSYLTVSITPILMLFYLCFTFISTYP